MSIKRIFLYLTIGLIISIQLSACNSLDENIPVTGQGDLPNQVFLPLIAKNYQSSLLTDSDIPLIHIPYKNVADFPQDAINEMAISWFGSVGINENYADIRIGYNDTNLFIYIAIIDRLLWYDTSPTINDLENWDAVSVFLIDNYSSHLSSDALKITAQLAPSEQDRGNYQVVSQWNGGTWQTINSNVQTETGWRGEGGLNTPDDNRGWTIKYTIPFSEFNSSGKPTDGSLWRLGITLNDRDYLNREPTPPKYWPPDFKATQIETWGTLSFGLISGGGSESGWEEELILQEGTNGITVPDASPGDLSLCGEGVLFWTEWGNMVYQFPDNTIANIQNQRDIADWPCFSKYYVQFPIDSIPQNSEIISAQLTLHQFGNSGNWGDATFQPYRSLIQIMRTEPGWDENTLNWNNAPLPLENIDQTWVEPLEVFPGWPGVAYNWDVTRAIETALSNGQNFISLALYSADGAYHSGKYFSTSDVDDWNMAARPTLSIRYNTP